MFKLGFSILLTMGLIMPSLWAQAADLKIGIIDGMDIVSKSEKGKRVQQNLKKKTEELARPAEQRQRDIAKMVSEFEKQAGVMKEDARKRKEEEIQKKIEETRRQGADAEKQFAQYQEKELGPLFQELEQAVKAVAQENKLDLVLDKRNSGLLFVNPSLDLTEKVRSKFGQ
jgi:outer membrane protein